MSATANAINLTLSMQVFNGSYAYIFTQSVGLTQNALGAAANIMTARTTPAALDVASLSTLGYATFQNLDATNFVTIGTYVSSTYYPAIKLKAGESAVLRLVPGLTYYAQSDTANVQLSYCVQSD